MEPTKHQYDYDSATVHGFLRPPRPRGRVQGQHRGQPRDAGRPQLPPRGRLRRRPRHLRQHRRQPRRLPERLGHGPVPELGRRARARGVRDPPRRRLHDRRLQLRCQAPPPEHRPDRPVPRAHRRHRHARPRAARRRRHARGRATSSAMRDGRYAGWDGRAGRRASWAARASLATLEARVAAGEIDPRPGSGRQERLENLVNQRIWAADREG